MNVFDPHVNIQAVLLVGTGGTGSQIARHLARLSVHLRQGGQHAPRLVFIDPDRVEARNVGRQLFTVAEIGQNKAVTLMRRLNAALGLDITAIPELLNAAKHGERYGQVVIGAVDNHEARQELAKWSGVWIDCGNHARGGQVVVGNTGDRAVALRHLDGKDGKYTVLPNASLLFPALLQPEPTPELVPAPSCAEQMAAGEQHLYVNDYMAIAAATYVEALLTRRPITTFATFVSLDGLSVRSLPICREELLPYL